MNKKYWLRGLIMGIIVYGILIIIAYQFDGPELKGAGTAILAVVISPTLLVGPVVGWIYGRKQRSKIMK